MDIKSVIERIIIREGLDIKSFEIAAVLSQDAAGKLLRGETKTMQIKSIAKIKKAFPEYFKEPKKATEQYEYSEPPNDAVVEAGEVKYDKMGSFLFQKSYNDGNYKIFRISGNSMEPTLYHGDEVVCRQIPQKDIRRERVYVIQLEDKLLIKRLIDHSARYNKIVLKSDNSDETRTQDVTPNEVLSTWEVITRITNILKPPSDMYDKLSELEADLHFLRSEVEELQEQIQNL